MRRKLVIAGSILLIAGLGYLLGWSNLISVKSLQINGAPTSAIEKDIAKVASIKIGTPLARIEPRIIASQIERFEWVEKCGVSRNWINGRVAINIKSREPLASVGGKYVDKSGVLFIPAINPAASLPQIIAPDGASRSEAISFFLNLPDNFGENVSSLTATGKQFLLQLSYQGASYGVNWGQGSDSRIKIKLFTQLVGLEENKKISYLDLSNPKSPIVR